MGNAEEGAETRSRLLESAIHLFSLNGAAPTSVQDIVARAEVTKGAFYHHFESKAHLMHAVHDRLLGNILDTLREIVDRGEEPVQTLEDVIVAIVCNNIRHKASVSIVMSEYPHLPGSIVREIKGQRDEFEALVVRAIDAGKRTSDFESAVPSNVIAFGLIGMCAWTIHWYDAAGPLTPEEIGRSYAALMTSGLCRKRVDAATS